MSKEHAKAAKQIPGSVIRCGPRRMLQYICEKCGSGQPFKAKSGKSLTIPAGKFQCTDKEMMKVLGVDSRRQTMIDWRRVMKKATRGAVTTRNEFKQGYRYPTIIYFVEIEKLEDLVPSQTENASRSHTDFVCGSNAENVCDSDTEIVYPHTKTAAHTGFPSETGVPPAPKAGAQLGHPKGKRGAADADNAAQRSTAVGKLPPSRLFISVKSCLGDLVSKGYESNPSEEIVSRICFCIEANLEANLEINYSVSEVFEYVSKAKWIHDRTQGRLDWLADRFESDDKRSLMTQFNSFVASRRRHEAESGGLDLELEGLCPQHGKYVGICFKCPVDYGETSGGYLEGKITCMRDEACSLEDGHRSPCKIFEQEKV